MKMPGSTLVTQVTDLRTGLIHPRRHWDGRFMGRFESARTVLYRAVALDRDIRDVLSTRGPNRDFYIHVHDASLKAWNDQAAR